MSTPVPQDIFSRFMVGAFDERQIIAVSTGFQAFFGRPETGAKTLFSPDSSLVDIDIIRGNERIAALIPRGNIGRSMGSTQKNLRVEQFSSFSRKYPLVEEEGDIEAGQLLNRIAGENPYQSMSRMERLRYHALNIHHESIRRQVRLFEVLAAESILTGKQSAILGTADANLQYDFRRNTTHIATVNAAWSGAGSTAILTDIDAACAKIRANGKVLPDMMIMGSTAINSFIKSATVSALADNRRFSFIQAGTDARQMPPKYQRFIDGGMIYQGTLKTPAGFELYIFTYLEVYTAANGTATKYLADDKVVIASTQARCDRYFGPSETLPMVPSKAALYREYFGFDPMAPPMPPKMKAAGSIIDPAMFYSDAYVSNGEKAITIRCQSAPIFATTMTDAFVVLDTEP